MTGTSDLPVPLPVYAERKTMYRDDRHIDYVKAYSDVSDVGSELAESVKPGKVKAIYGMYVSLNTLDVSGQTDVSEVEELVVVADVVAIDSSRPIKLPGTRRVVILCRVIEFTHEPVDRRGLPLQTNIRTSLRQSEDTYLQFENDVWRQILKCRTPVRFDAERTTQLYVYSQGERGTVRCDGKIYYTEESKLSFELRPLAIWIIEKNLFRGCTVQMNQRGDQFSNIPFEIDVDLSCNVETYRKYVERRELRLPGDSPVEEPWGSSFGFVVAKRFTVPVHLLVDPHVVMGLQALLLQAEGILLYGEDSAGKDAVDAAVLHITWLIDFVLPNRDKVQENGSLEQLHSLYGRAQGLLSLYAGGTPKLIVPPLNYKLYRDSIEQIASTARLYDEDLKATLRQLQTIEGSNSNFVKLFKVLAAKEKDVEEMKGRVLELQNVELEEAKRKLVKLSANMKEQEKAMEEAKNKMNEEVKDYEAKQKAEAVLAVFSAIGSAVASGGATAVSAIKSLVDTGKDLKKVIEILKKLAEVMKALNKLSDLLGKNSAGEAVLSTRLPNSPTASDWYQFDSEVKGVVNTIPDEISERHLWEAKCRNVAAIGREISLTTFYVTTTQYQMKLSGWEKDIAFKQRERLLSIDLAKPPTPLDLVMNLELQSLRMRNSLLATLNIQKGAIRYHYLQAPKKFARMGPTIYNIQEMLIQNDLNAVAFHETLGKSSELRREYVLKGIPVQTLLDGDEFHFTIAKDNPIFPASWQRVRIQHLTMRFTGAHRPSTDTGEIYLLLSGDHVFVDRYNDEDFEFEAAKALHYPNAYNLETGECTLDNREIPSELGNFMRMTPFSRWKLLVPNSAYENKGIHFKDAAVDAVTEIIITFHMTLVRKIERQIEEEVPCCSPLVLINLE